MAGFTTWLYDSTLAKVFRWGGDSVSGSGNVVDQTDAPWHSPRGPLEVTDGDDEYETVAASATDQALGATGAAGDYLKRLIIVVATAATAQVQIKDGSGSAITVFPNSPGGGVGTYEVNLGLASLSGAWKVTTGAGVSVIACGDFT